MDGQRLDLLRPFVRSQITTALELCKNTLQKVRYERNSFLTIRKVMDDYIGAKTSKVQIFIMPGLRGVGKTTLLRQSYMHLHSSHAIPTEKILLIDVRRLTEEYNSNLFELFEAYEKEVLKSPFESLKDNLFVLIDEAHYDSKWDEAITVMVERSKKIFFIVTGSSALRLTTSDLERRSIVELILPLNFHEYSVLRYGIFPPKGSQVSQLVRKALFETPDVSKSQDILNSVLNNLKEHYFPKFKRGLLAEIKDFLRFGGFPFTLIDFSSHVKAVDALTRALEQMIRSDVFPFVETLQSKDTRRYFAVLHCLVKSIGNPNSNTNIFESLKAIVIKETPSKKLISSDSAVYSVIDNLIKTKLIFPVKPFSAEEKISNFAWKYYFATSTILSSLLLDMGAFDEQDNALWGKIIENEVAAVFEKNHQLGKIGPSFFDFKEEGADLILYNNGADRRVFEITYSDDKSERQVINTMSRAKSTFGVIIGDYQEVKVVKGILQVPYILLFMI